MCLGIWPVTTVFNFTHQDFLDLLLIFFLLFQIQHSMMGWELLKNKGGSISFQNPFLLCPSSLLLGIGTQSVLGTCVTNFHSRFLLHRINYCIVVFEYSFYQSLWLNMTKTAWNCKMWWNSEPEGQQDSDWTQIWTPSLTKPQKWVQIGGFP